MDASRARPSLFSASCSPPSPPSPRRRAPSSKMRPAWRRTLPRRSYRSTTRATTTTAATRRVSPSHRRHRHENYTRRASPSHRRRRHESCKRASPSHRCRRHGNCMRADKHKEATPSRRRRRRRRRHEDNHHKASPRYAVNRLRGGVEDRSELNSQKIILGTLKKASAAASSGYWLGPPLIRPCKNLCSLSFAPRASGPLRPAPGASEDGAAPNYFPLAFDLRARRFRRAP